MMKKHHPSLVIALLIIVCALPVFAQTSSEALLLNADTSSFPRLTFDVVVRDDGQLQSGLTSDNFRPSEPYAELSVSAQRTQSIALAVVINLNQDADVNLIKDTLRAYFQNYWRQGDRTALYLVSNTSDPQAAIYESLQDILNTIDGLSATDSNFRVNNALVSALAFLRADQQTNPDDSQQALLVGSYLFSRVDSAANAFAGAGIPLHGVAAHINRNPAQTDLIRDAVSSGEGIYINNQAGRFLGVSGTTIVPLGELLALYDIMDATRTSYRVSYRTTSTDISSVRSVTLNVTTLGGQRMPIDISYPPPLQAPSVSLGNFNPNPERADVDGGELDNPGTQIGVLVSFPDTVERAITRIELEVTANVEGIGTVTGSYDPTQLSRDTSGAYLIPWDLTGYNLRGREIGVTISVTVVDAAGLSQTVTQLGTVNVAPIPPTNTPVPTNTLAPTNTLVPTNTPIPSPTPIENIVEFVATSVANNPDQGGNGALSSGAITQVLAFFATGVGSIVGVIALGVALFLVARTKTGKAVTSYIARQTQTAVYNARTAIFGADGPAPDDTQFISTAKKVYGTLKPNTSGFTPIPITAKEMAFGRVIESGIDVEINNRLVSHRHCVIQVDKKNDLYVIDSGSRNGTFVNGSKLEPNKPVKLTNGSILGIGQEVTYTVDRGGNAAELEYTEIFDNKSSADIHPDIRNSGAFEKPPTADDDRKKYVTEQYNPVEDDDQAEDFSFDDDFLVSRDGRPVKSNIYSRGDDVRADDDDHSGKSSSTPSKSASSGKHEPTDEVDDDWF